MSKTLYRVTVVTPIIPQKQKRKLRLQGHKANFYYML
jgi:hypothetical protein